MENTTNEPTAQPQEGILSGPLSVGLSFGQKAVGLSFNPSNSSEVDVCKSNCANLIDQMHNLRQTSESSEQKRLASVAITEMQTAQMWAVKALTWKD